MTATKTKGTASKTRVDRRTAAGLAVLLVVATLAVYAQTTRAGFITADDGVYVTQNPTVQAGLTGAGLRWAFGFRDGNWIPLTWISLMLDAEIGGGRPGAFHTTNVALHLASTLLLFLALARMTGRLGRSGFVALLFAVHPLHVESVAWVSERKDVLSGLFFMLGLLAWDAHARRPSGRAYTGAVAALGAGLMAKPMLVTVPFVYLLLDLWPLARKEPLRKLVVEKVPLIALCVVSAGLTFAAQRGAGAMSTMQAIPADVRAGNALVSYATYLVKAVVPTGLAFFYPHPGRSLPAWQIAGSGALLIAVTLFAWRSIRKIPYVAVGWVWYVAMLVPVIGLVQVGIQARADRYTYLPLIGIFLAATWAFADLTASRKAVSWVAASALGAVMTFAGWKEAGHWRDSVTLYTRALAVTKDNAVAHNNLGLAHLEAGDLDGTIRECREALRIDPGHPEAPNHLATALTRQGRTNEAIAVYRQALAIRPGDSTLHSNLGTVLGESGDFAGAEAEFREALRLAPGSSDAHYNMGVLLARQGRYDAAIEELAVAQRLSPFDAEIRQSLEQARALAGR